MQNPDELFESAARSHRTGNLDEAQAAYRQVLAIQPGHLAALFNLAGVLRDLKQTGESRNLLERLVALRPDIADAWHALGLTLEAEGKSEAALAAHQKAAATNPNFGEALLHASAIHFRAGRAIEALELAGKADVLRPNFGPILRAKAMALYDLGAFDEAITIYESAIKCDPADPAGHILLGMALLCRGDFQRGWIEYQWRTKRADILASAANISGPMWDGADLAGKTILLFLEQGFGDAIQFIRYASLLARSAKKVVVACHEPLVRLFSNSFPQIIFIAAGQAVPPFDVQSPLMNLPAIFGTTLKNIPAQVPYLKTDADDRNTWRNRIPKGAINIGLVWAGSPRHMRDQVRSIDLEMFAPLARFPGLKFWSLQKGERALVENQPTPFPIADLAAHLTDFSQTAAAMEALDMVISVDTSIVHLAGALARPVWTLVPHCPDWRWQRDRADSPWYPTMRLFRQPNRGNWQAVIDSLGVALREHFNI